MCAVGIQERAGDIHDLLSSPGKHQSRILGDHSYGGSLQVLLCSVFQEFCLVLFIYYNSHTLLGLGDSDLRTVQSRVFLRNQVEVYLQAVCQLADGYGYSACAEIVTLLNQTGYLRTTEQSLDLTLGGSVTLLHLCAAGLNGLLSVYLGGTGSAAAAVASGLAAKKNDQISRIGGLTDDILSGRCAHDRANLHSLCHIVGVINLFYIAGSQTDLVAVGAVAVGCAAYQLLLGQLALQCLLYRYGGICRSGYTHSLIYIGTA